jgi:hypothetical protein
MQGYEAVRDAAARGIRFGGGHPVRAEDFPASSPSPRTACLDGVASCDGLALILGGHYGFITPAGVSATQEEYQEARRRRKRVFVFLEDVEREPRQEAFAREVSDLIGGHWRKTFSTADELEALVEQAVREATPMVAESTAEAGATRRIRAAVDRRPPGAQGIVWLQAAWATGRDEEVVDPLRFGERAYQGRNHQLAHAGEAPLFAYEQGKRVEAGLAHLRIAQGEADDWRGGRDLVVLDIDADGTLSVALNVTGLDPAYGMGRLGQMYLISPGQARRRLEQAWAFAAARWNEVDPYLRHEPVFYNVVLHDVDRRRWAEPTPQDCTRMAVPGACPDNPLWLYDRARPIGRAEVRAPAAEIPRARDVAARRFAAWEAGW